MGSRTSIEELHFIARTDSNGNMFLVASGLDARDAEDLRARMSSNGHRQYYSVHAYPEGGLDRTLRRLGISR